MTVPADRAAGTRAALLLLTDGRLPAGGHGHSAGVEAATADGRVVDTATLEAYLRGRLSTTGLVDAHLAAAACAAARGAVAPAWAALDTEAAARCPAPALRTASRTQGRGLLRVAARAWPGPAVHSLQAAVPAGPMWPVALGAVAADAGLGPVDAAVAAAHAAVSGPAWAAVRLLGLDPIAVATVLAALAPMIDRQAGQLSAGIEAGGPAAWSSLPADGGPVVDVAAQAHAGWEVRLFAS